jgi:hypothetical protein
LPPCCHTWTEIHHTHLRHSTHLEALILALALYRSPAQTFTTYEYLPSEFEREKLMAKFERLKKKLHQVGG